MKFNPRSLRRVFLGLISVAVLLCCQYGIGNHSVAAGGLGDVNQYTAVTTAYARQSNSVVYHPASGKIYASIPSSRDSKGNSIARIDPLTGTVEQTYWIGSEPNKLALAVDGNTIYVGIDGALSLRKFDASTNTPRDQFPAGVASFYGPMIPRDFALSPVNANVVAVARESFPNSVAVFDNGVQRPNVGGVRPFISFANTESTLFAIGSSSFMEKISVSETGVASVAVLNPRPWERSSRSVVCFLPLVATFSKPRRGH